MADKSLIDYIKQMTATGADRETIKAALASAGWSSKDTEDGLAAAYAELAQPAQVQKPAAMFGTQPSPVSSGVGPSSAIKTGPLGQGQPAAADLVSQAKPQQQQPQIQPQPQMQARPQIQPQSQPIKIEPAQIKQTPAATASVQSAADQSPVVLKSQPAAAYNPVILNNISSGAEASKIKKSPNLAVIISVSAVVVLVLGGSAAWYFLMGPGAVHQAVVTQTTDNTPVVAQVSNLGLDQVRNAKYIEDGKEIQLTNGIYSSLSAVPLVMPLVSPSGTPLASSSFASLATSTTINFSGAVLDDLNADGSGDAAVILRRKDGASPEIPQLAILLNQGGQPNFADMVSFPSGTIIQSISSDRGVIILSMLEKASGTQAFYPDQQISQVFTLSGGKLLAQTPVLGMRIFNHAQIADFEGRSFLVYQFSYSDSDMAVSMENQNRILISEKNSSLNHSLTISYEGGRGYSPTDYWNQVLKKSCVGCAIVSSTPDTAGLGSATSSSAVNIPGAQNTLTIENKTSKWVIWDSPTGTARLFIAQLQKPTDAIEKILQTFKFVDWADSDAASSTSITALSSFVSTKAPADLKTIKDISEISLSDRTVIFSQSSKTNKVETASMVMDGGIWKVEQ